MILTDTGPLVAICDKRDPYMQQVDEVFKQLREPMLTTDACITEAMYLLGEAAFGPHTA